MEPREFSPRRYEYIDALRGLAALSVALYHGLIFGGKEHLARAYQDVIEQGARGVQLFYVLSAFTLFLSLRERTTGKGISIPAYFVRRLFRIAPLFYAAVLFYLWLYGTGPRWALGDQARLTWANVLANMLFVNSVSPYWINSVVPVGWSVAVEMAFYCLLPLLFLTITSRTRAVLFLVGSYVLAAAANGFLVAHPLIADRRLWGEFLYYWLPNQLPVFALGILLFFAVKDLRLGEGEPSRGERAGGMVLLAISVGLMLLLASRGVLQPPTLVLYGAAFALLTLALALHPIKILVNPFFCGAGKISYSIYLTHIGCLRAARLATTAILGAAATWRARMATTVLIEIALTLLVSMVTYRVIEAPGQSLGKAIIHRYGL